MYLNQTAEYGLRAMAELALLPRNVMITAEDLAKRTDIPRHYISKIMRRLVSAGLVHAQKGHGGGFTLARTPRRIRFIDILEALDVHPATDHCAFGWPQCDPDNPCPLHDSMVVMNEAFARWAEKSTLAEIRDGADAMPPRAASRK